MTHDELQTAVEANTAAIDRLTGAIDILVSRFIRPNAQQHLESMDRLERIEPILERHAEVITTIDLKLDRIADQQTTNAQQITANAQQIAASTEAITQFDTRLEETRQLVAKNSSDIAQLSVKQDRNADAITRLEAAQENNATQIEALAELTRTQLTGIIGNGRRIDRLEQQAS